MSNCQSAADKGVTKNLFSNRTSAEAGAVVTGDDSCKLDGAHQTDIPLI